MPLGPALNDLRMKYNAAHSAYRACVRAAAEAGMSGSETLPALLEREAAALRVLSEARGRLLAAMAEAAGGPADAGAAEP